VVTRYQHIRKNADILGAGDALLALMGLTEPNAEQQVGALLLGEFVLKVNRFLPLK
jgi:hypothetical protein